jgi:UrcA family protein
MLFPQHARTRLSALAAAGLALMAFAAPAQAADDATAITVNHVDRALESRGQAEQLLGRLSEAAMEACGASSFSLTQYRQAVRGSACWRSSMTDVVQRIDNPYLTAAFEGRGLQQALVVGSDKVGGR